MFHFCFSIQKVFQRSCSQSKRVADLHYSLRRASSWKVAIVGSGPSGCYTAKYLQSALAPKEGTDLSSTRVKIDILERLPTAYGLVRNGVAPDHPEVKNVQNDFDQLLTKKENNIQFYGNVNVGKDVSLKELRELYDVVVLAYGCESDRPLQIPGNDLDGILSAREFVAWYNGHVDFDWVGPIVERALTRKSSTNSNIQNIVVLGHGNVALDCARILAKTREELETTDITTQALDVLDCNPKTRQISIVGRRGHVQGAFTIKEVRELTKLPHADFVVRPDELALGKSTEASQKELKSSRPRARIDKLLMAHCSASESESDDSSTTQVHLRFLVNPVRFEASEDGSSLAGVVCERTQLVGETGQQHAEGTGEEEALDAELALVSIGYKGVAIEGTEPWFDESRGVLKNTHGLVDATTDSLGGLYVSGWLKRGPTGIIGTNIGDAKDTVATIVHSIQKLSPKEEGKDLSLSKLLEERGVAAVDWHGYQKIDAAETSESRKRKPQQPREKITTREELLQVALS